jgi:lipopolysaccharide/colanic/teichoic acid biosynthesis glycosyltransferase
MYNDGPSDEEIGFNKDNPRIPNRTIKLIRDLRADELPQILQVLTGELSMVGPRKLPGQMLKYVEKTTDQDLYDEWRELTDQLPPGLTGPAQLSWLETDIRDKAVLERAMRLDNNYAVNGSLKEDLLILGKTAFNLGRIGLRLSHT